MRKLLHRLGILLLLTVATLLVVAANTKGLRDLKESFLVPQIYWKDTNQLYLMGKAIHDGISPYLPLSELAALWLPEWHPYPYPSPYTPFVAALSTGITAIGYRGAVMLNFWMEVLSFAVLTVLLLRWWGGPWYRWEKLLAVILLWTCSPITVDLRCGQMMAMLALVLVAAWLALRDGRDTWGGALLGLFVAIKLITWPLLLFLILRQRWRAVAAAGVVVLVANLAGLATLGVPTVLDYYTRVGGTAAGIWRGYEANLSSWSWGDRIFRGVGWGYRLDPLINWPWAAAVGTWILPVLLLGVAMILAHRARTFDTAFGLLCAASIFLSPVSWSFYALLAIVPVAVLLKRLAERKAAAEVWGLTGIFLAMLIAPPDFSPQVARAFGDPKTVTFAAGLFTQLPNLGLLGLVWILCRTDAPAAPTKTPPEAEPARDDGSRAESLAIR